VCYDAGSLGESTLMKAALENDMVSAAGNVDDADATVDLRPAVLTPSNKTVVAELQQQMSFTKDRQHDDDADVTMDVADGKLLFLIHLSQNVFGYPCMSVYLDMS